MSQTTKYAGMDLNQAVNVFTKSLMWKITEGHPVDNEEIEALNAMRENAGMKPLNIAVPSGAKSEPAQQAQPKREAPKREAPRQDGAPRAKKPSHEEQNYESYAPQPIVVNGKQFEGQLLPDNSQWTHRFYIKSESSGRLYTVSQNKNRRYWACSCPGWIGHRKCKHLTSMGLPTHEQPFEAQLKAASVKTAAIKIADETWSPLAHVLAAEIIHSDDELSSMMESALPEVEGEVHIEGPEAGPSNDELHANSSPLNGPEGSPAFDGDLKHPERQNTNAIREALETQVEMEVGKPIDQKQEEVAMQEKVQDAALAQGAGSLAGGAAATEVTAKPGTQIIINVASWDYPAKKAALLNKTASYSRKELKQAGKDFLKKLRTAAISVAQGEDAQGFHMLVDMNGREYVLRGPDA